MEYTKDIILDLNCGQAKRKFGFKRISKIKKIMSKHKMLTIIVSITLMLFLLDFMLVASFVKVLGNL